MRTIKYRGKGVYDDLWWVGDLLHNDDKVWISDDTQMLHLVSSDTVGLYTGLFDKDKQPIFEGDIFHMGDPKILYVVKWLDCGLIGKQLGSSSIIGLQFHVKWIKIVGNEFDNPENL